MEYIFQNLDNVLKANKDISDFYKENHLELRLKQSKF